MKAEIRVSIPQIKEIQAKLSAIISKLKAMKKKK